MTKNRNRGNREAKKPKTAKKPVLASTSPFAKPPPKSPPAKPESK